MWNLLSGYCGLISLCQPAFIGLGGYALVIFTWNDLPVALGIIGGAAVQKLFSTGQGPAAPMGEMNFVVGDVMIGGFALAAAPADYEVTGVMTFIVNQDGSVACWGSNAYGQIGDGFNENMNEPTPVQNIGGDDSGAIAIGAGLLLLLALLLLAPVACDDTSATRPDAAVTDAGSGAVDATEVDKDTKVGDILDNALNDLAFMNGCEGLRSFRFPFTL